MADDMEIGPNNTIPTLPPLPGAAPLMHIPGKGEGHHWPLASTGTAVAAITTPQAPTQVLLQEGSNVLSITNAATLFSGTNATAEEADETPKKQSKPKRKFPNFSCAFSQDNPLLLGDESEGWDDEQGNLKALIASQKELEIAATCNLEDPVDEIQEFEYLVENVEVEKGKSDNND
jgi:hypothetical protein